MTHVISRYLCYMSESNQEWFLGISMVAKHNDQMMKDDDVAL